MQSRTFKTAVFYARSLTNKGGGGMRGDEVKGRGREGGKGRGDGVANPFLTQVLHCTG